MSLRVPRYEEQSSRYQKTMMEMCTVVGDLQKWCADDSVH